MYDELSQNHSIKPNGKNSLVYNGIITLLILPPPPPPPPPLNISYLLSFNDKKCYALLKSLPIKPCSGHPRHGLLLFYTVQGP